MKALSIPEKVEGAVQVVVGAASQTSQLNSGKRRR